MPKNEALDTKRHSLAHLMAACIQEMFPEARFGVGPVVEDGFYYDVSLGRSLTPDDLTGGTFTISNGGVYGSLMSTPILNAPQSGILGMHKIEQRPIALSGQVVIRPMMYVALSYDHRLVDGAQAVTFLVRVKEQVEDPARMVLEV